MVSTAEPCSIVTDWPPRLSTEVEPATALCTKAACASGAPGLPLGLGLLWLLAVDVNFPPGEPFISLALADATDDACALAVRDAALATMTECPGELPSSLATRREPIEDAPVKPARVELFGDAAAGGELDRSTLWEDADGDTGGGATVATETGAVCDRNTLFVGGDMVTVSDTKVVGGEAATITGVIGTTGRGAACTTT